MNCDKCRYYVDRPKTPKEADYQRNNGIFIDTRFCSLSGCDGSRFENRYKHEFSLEQDYYKGGE